ncbi:MAG: hypothetical protein IIB59_02385 [Planctomycetes bacterium]|nr:hypothetical protein [Planctomycetota bacterium]
MPSITCPETGACCRSDGDCFDDLSSEECMTLAGNSAGTGSTCETLGGDCDDRGACCAVTGSCLFVLSEQCEALEGGGVFTTIGEACSSQTCPAGACCNDDETCDIRTEAGCTGAYMDDDTICEIDSCVIGACCVDDRCVADIRLIECDLAGGLFAGAGSTCDDVDACLSGACCKGNCTCEADVLGFECKAEGGRFNASLTCADVDCLPGIVSSDPANCFTDVRKAHDVDDSTVTYGPDAITLTINCDAQNITEGDLDLRAVPDGPLPTPITLIYDPNDDRVVTVEFASNLAAGLYLCVKHNLRGAEVCIGSTPGDLDLDGDVTAADVDELIARMPTGDPNDDPKDPMDPFTPATEPCDIDRSGACTPLDLLTEIDMLNGAGEFDLLVEPYPACPTAGP